MRRLPDRIARHLAADLRPDGDLLAAVLAGGPTADADFAELVRRHGPLVWGVCRRALPAAADAEDAFQAVFLVLARRAGRLTAAPTVGPWLYRVAALTARNVRRRNARRLARTAALPPDLPAPAADLDLPLDLDAALLDLPEKYRSPIVLCHLLGFTRTEAAARLGCPEGTLSAWLSRGLTRLRARLGGHDPAKLLVLATASVPTGLAASAAWAAGAAAVAVPSTVTLIAEGVIRMFWVKKATAAAAALSAVFALGMGVGMSARVAVPSADAQEKAATRPATPAAPQVPATGTAPAAPPVIAPDLDAEVAVLKAKLRGALAAARAAEQGYQLTKEKLELQKTAPGALSRTELLNEQIALAKYEESVARAHAEVAELEARLAAVTAARDRAGKLAGPPPAAPQPAANTVEELDAQIKDLAARLQRIDTSQAELRANRDALVAKREELVKKKPAAAKPAGGYVLLSFGGDAKAFEITLSEAGADGKVIGTATVKGEALLAKLLARTRADPAAPAELRVGPALPGVDALPVLRACAAAGYKTVTFTGFAAAKWYEAAERTTADLIKEIEAVRRKP
jgi:RNA polymerase sigma factor (sigma-70 family)